MTRDLIVGLLFLSALFLLGTLTFMEEGLPFGPPPQKLVVQFNHVAGLVEGEPVRVRGYKVGKVRRLAIQGTGVEVHLELRERIPPLLGYSFEVASASTLGGKYIDYDPGNGPGEVDLTTHTLQGRGQDSDIFDSISRFIEDNKEAVQRVIRNLEEVTAQAREGKGLVGVLLRDESLASNLSDTVASLRRIVSEVEQGQGVLGALLSDQGLASTVRRILTNVEEISIKVNNGEGPIGVLLNDREMSAQLRRITRRVEDLMAEVQQGDGLLGRLISDPELAERAAGIFENLEDVSRDLREGQGLLARLIHDPALAQTFDEALSDLREIAAKINSGEGTLGKLIQSDDIYEEIFAAVRTLREATEDAREQAPINTFVNVLFSAF